jgi:hypothetical protein
MRRSKRFRIGTTALVGNYRAQAFLYTSLAISLAGLLVSLIYWLVNVDTASGGKILPLHRLLEGLLTRSQLELWKHLSQDASTVTSLVPLIFFFYTGRAALAFLFAPGRLEKYAERSRERFPFAPNYQTTWIQLGLIGTLWGFLLIGKHLKLGIDPAESVTVLVMAFGTALLSTFAGVVAAYIFAPPTCAAYHWLLREAGIGSKQPAHLLDDLKKGLRELSESAAGASRTLASGAEGQAALTESAARTSEALQKLQVDVSTLDFASPLGRIIDALVERASEAQAARFQQIEVAVGGQMTLLTIKIGEGLIGLGREIHEGQIAFAGQVMAEMARVHAEQREERKSEGAALLDSLAGLKSTLATEQRRLAGSLEGSFDRLVATSPVKEVLASSQQTQKTLVEIERRLAELRSEIGRLARSRDSSGPGGKGGRIEAGRFPRLARGLAMLRNLAVRGSR